MMTFKIEPKMATTGTGYNQTTTRAMKHEAIIQLLEALAPFGAIQTQDGIAIQVALDGVDDVELYAIVINPVVKADYDVEYEQVEFENLQAEKELEKQKKAQEKEKKIKRAKEEKAKKEQEKDEQAK